MIHYCVIKDTTKVIDGGTNTPVVMLQNALSAGFAENQVEILDQEQFNARKRKESVPEPQLSEIEKLRLEQAQANAELVQLIMMMGG